MFSGMINGISLSGVIQTVKIGCQIYNVVSIASPGKAVTGILKITVQPVSNLLSHATGIPEIAIVTSYTLEGVGLVLDPVNYTINKVVGYGIAKTCHSVADATISALEIESPNVQSLIGTLANEAASQATGKALNAVNQLPQVDNLIRMVNDIKSFKAEVVPVSKIADGAALHKEEINMHNQKSDPKLNPRIMLATVTRNVKGAESDKKSDNNSSAGNKKSESSSSQDNKKNSTSTSNAKNEPKNQENNTGFTDAQYGAAASFADFGKEIVGLFKKSNMSEEEKAKIKKELETYFEKVMAAKVETMAAKEDAMAVKIKLAEERLERATSDLAKAEAQVTSLTSLAQQLTDQNDELRAENDRLKTAKPSHGENRNTLFSGTADAQQNQVPEPQHAAKGLGK